MSKVAYIVLANGLSVVLDNKAHTIDSTHPNFLKIKERVQKKLWDGLETLLDIPKAIAHAAAGAVTVKNGQVWYAGQAVHSYLATRILDIMNQGFDVTPWLNFMYKLYQNPSKRAVDELYGFLEVGKLPICPDGDFLAYKYVRQDYKDFYSGKFDNRVGQKPWMDRNKVDDNKDRTCSQGLHFCSKGYLPNYGTGSGYRVMIVKVNPRDVVSIPADHNSEKARTCTYEVVGEIDEDYGFVDMDKSAVLPAPRKVSKSTTVSRRPLEASVITFLNAHKGPITVRRIAKALGVTNSDIVNNSGDQYGIYSGHDECSLSDSVVLFRDVDVMDAADCFEY
jgi:hypothetical protein